MKEPYEEGGTWEISRLTTAEGARVRVEKSKDTRPR